MDDMRAQVEAHTRSKPPTPEVPVSATGPEKWDAADWTAFDQHVFTRTWGAAYPPMRGADKPPSMMTAIDQGYLASQRRTAARLAALEALLGKVAANEANDLTAEQVRQIVEDAVVRVEVTIRDETEPEPS